MTKYLDEIQRGMDLLASDPRTIFIGQAMKYKGHAVSRQVANYPEEKRLEFPVAEDFQAGFCLGAALEGYIPICVYPRHDFTILAFNQIYNHIEKWALMGGGSPKVIIKCLVGAKKPLNGGHQHTANYIDVFREMLSVHGTGNLKIRELAPEDTDIFEVYQEALNETGSYLISEYTEAY